ncbi:(+)-trans-carveol dehydrogenase [Pseudonocardia thermophila]|uniref:(+)-trans-carveol dehydrogenase n=1 Tax=Pseudonocardia thermophila TaxID=1848 RepID=A0A1M6P5V9_PSETH|nr:mycofactocin-coupled SDR family oxidoreductase [Pseudonocardia thermophila]SHK03272.1 (+)-trans-carveol dehydrogenase [Pseudonocardia thermophila]
MGRLDGKVVFITGIARGQGRSHAVRMAEEGAAVIGVDICANIAALPYDLATEQDLAETAALIAAAGGKAVLRKADVRDAAALADVVADGVAQFGRLDTVVANAGVISAATTGLDVPDEEWRVVTDVCYGGVVNTVRAAVPHIRAGGRGGSVIIISSVGGLAPIPTTTHYAAAKHAVVGLMRNLAVELGPESIRVNTVNPSTVDSPMVQNPWAWRLFMPDLENPTAEDAVAPDGPHQSLNVLPTPFIDPVDVSNAVLFLASDEARFITGVALPVDAGWLLKK